MTAASRRGARAEERAAKALGTKRVHRRRGESAPDLVPVLLPSGVRLGPEVKSRSKLPALVVGALSQARGYFQNRAIPIAVLFVKGEKRGIVALDLDAFAGLVGLDVAALPEPRPLSRPRSTRQLELFPTAQEDPRGP